ncbi:MAG: M48 family metallopeptidase [Ruminococcus sp.]|nr:M48 family metallopeptidase [Ruminococcus sp.]
MVATRQLCNSSVALAATAPFTKGSLNYTLIKSRRKTISVELRDGEVVVRAPNRMPKREINAFVEKHTEWIEKQQKKWNEQQAQLGAIEKLTEDELDALYQQAKAVIPDRVRYYADLLGVDYGRITIRCQRTRWGSCSAKKNLNFNCLLMLTLPEVLDSVVAHEVCHLREMNHSARFYALVTEIFPDYHHWNRWLKDNGKALMARIPD